MEIKDRIKEFRRVKASELMANPLNHRIHSEKQRKRLRSALKDIGFAGALLAREGEDGKLVLIDGHMRASECGESDVPVLILNVDEKEANKILASYDAIGAMADIDNRILKQLVDSFSDDDPFKTDGIKEALEPAEDIIKREKEEKRKKLEARVKEVEEYKNGDKKFGVGPNEWWRIREGKTFFSGSHKHPSFVNAITKLNVYDAGSPYYTVFAHSPIDDPSEYLVDEQFIFMSDEVWTFTNNDWRNIKPIIDRGYVKGIYTFVDSGQAQLAIFESSKRDEPFVKIDCGLVSCSRIAGRRSKSCPWTMPEPTGGSVVVSKPVHKYLRAIRYELQEKKILPIFIAPNVNTGRIFRSLYGGHYTRCFFSEPDIEKCEILLANAFKYMPSGSSLATKGRPPRRIEEWTTAS